MAHTINVTCQLVHFRSLIIASSKRCTSCSVAERVRIFRPAGDRIAYRTHHNFLHLEGSGSGLKTNRMTIKMQSRAQPLAYSKPGAMEKHNETTEPYLGVRVIIECDGCLGEDLPSRAKPHLPTSDRRHLES
jgi:hypothetical protein